MGRCPTNAGCCRRGPVRGCTRSLVFLQTIQRSRSVRKRTDWLSSRGQWRFLRSARRQMRPSAHGRYGTLEIGARSGEKRGQCWHVPVRRTRVHRVRCDVGCERSELRRKGGLASGPASVRQPTREELLLRGSRALSTRGRRASVRGRTNTGQSESARIPRLSHRPPCLKQRG